MTKWKNFQTRSTATVEVVDYTTGACEVHVKGAGGNSFRTFESNREANEYLRRAGFKMYNRFSKSWQ